jgi:N-methylhydantoinase A
MYEFQFVKPPELIRRAHRYEIDERVAADGSVIRELDEAEVRELCRTLRAEAFDAVAISLINSFRNPSHERRIGEIVREELGDAVFICTSFAVLPEIREYERTSTTVVNAYVGPVVHGYLDRLASNLAKAGASPAISVMQSGGGLSSIAQAGRRPAGIIESGPAAGVIAAAELARLCGFPNVIAFDMGGTTTKASMIENYEPARTSEYEVGSGINISSRLVKGGGHPIRLPFIDVSEIGAGGGSIIVADIVAGTIKVGPDSAGADPGPACYDRGGRLPTLTDALVVLGMINPAELVGGELRIEAGLSHAAIRDKVALPLGISVEKAAAGAVEIAVATMTRAVKAVSTYRGRDPRNFALVAFGGNGPVFAAHIASALGIRRIVVPPHPGVFSAVGLMVAVPESEAMRSIYAPLLSIDSAEIMAEAARLTAEVLDDLKPSATARVEVRASADLKYSGQAYELTIPIDGNSLVVDDLVESFHVEHEKTYGHAARESPIDIVNIRVVARVLEQGRTTLADVLRGDARLDAQPTARRIQFGPDDAVETDVVGRRAIGGDPVPGPLVIEEYDATTVVPPGWTVRLDKHGNVELSR